MSKLKETEQKHYVFGFDDIPLEIVYKILGYLSTEDLVDTAAYVCKQWGTIAYDPVMWKSLSLDKNYFEEEIVEILSHAQLLEKLTVERSFDLAHYLPTVYMNCPNLKCLVIEFTSVITNEVLEKIVEFFPGLESLNIRGCSGFNTYDAIKVISSLQKLRRLDISHSKYSKIAFDCIAEDFRSLEALYIDEIPSITDRDVIAIIKHHKNTIKTLWLDGELLTDLSYSELSTCKKLQQFGVSYARMITDEGLNGLLNLTNLRIVVIRYGEQLTAEGLLRFFENGSFSNLEKLDLGSCCALEDDGVNAIAKKCKYLRHLSLEWCWSLTDRALENILENLRFMVTLNLLGMMRINGTCLHRVPENLPDLRYLDLQQCGAIEDDIMISLASSHPQLTIIDYYGSVVSSFDTSCDNSQDNISSAGSTRDLTCSQTICSTEINNIDKSRFGESDNSTEQTSESVQTSATVDVDGAVSCSTNGSVLSEAACFNPEGSITNSAVLPAQSLTESESIEVNNSHDK